MPGPATAIFRYVGDSPCVSCEGWGWRFPRREPLTDEPRIDGVVFYQCQPCQACSTTGRAD